MIIRCRRVTEDAILPSRANSTDAGLDLYSTTDLTIYNGLQYKIDTGIQIELPHGYFGMIADKSSIGAKGIKVLGGIIDEGYRGNLIVVLSSFCTMVEIKKGQKIAQLLVLPVAYPLITEVNELSDSDRGIKGFGSSGS